MCFIFLLSSCTTPYQPNGTGGGYSEIAYNRDTYYVAFHGNQNTSQETMESYLLRRAAELTVNKGYRYFVLINYYSNPFRFRNSGLVTSYLSTDTVSAQIKILHSNERYPQAFDARIVINNFVK